MVHGWWQHEVMGLQWCSRSWKSKFLSAACPKLGTPDETVNAEKPRASTVRLSCEIVAFDFQSQTISASPCMHMSMFS